MDIHAHHHHVHIPSANGSLNTAFIVGIALNSAYVIIEGICGFIYHSMGLLSDAGHNLSDVAALTIAMVAFRLMAHKPDEKHTFGYKKFSIDASLINALLLYAAVGIILVESIEKLVHPTHINGFAVAWIAGVGVVVNGVTAWLFVKDQGKDMNVKGAFLHMAADTLVSIGVVVSGIVIHFTGWYIIDPIMGIVIALVIAWSTKSLLVQSMRMSVDAVPDSVDMPALEKALSSVDGVKSIHHLHVWPLSTTENALTVHAVITDVNKLNQTIAAIKDQARRFGITHATVEAETESSSCNDHVLFSND